MSISRATEAPAMQLPRLRFTLRWMMIAVAISAVTIALAKASYRCGALAER